MRLAVVGDPVAHSLSPAMHTAALAAAEIPGSYVRRQVDPSGMVAVADDVRAGRLDGVNVTMPHKQLAASLCDRLDAVAARAGAVNTIARVGGDLVGHNTDVAGIRSAWARAGLTGRGRALVLGNGGAAAAALLALEGRPLLVAGRHRGRAGALAASLGIAVTEVAWAEPCEAVVVNATPLGMRGESLPSGLLEAATGLFDMAYGSEPTPAVSAAAAAGLPHSDGIEMLAGQAVESFRIWTGVAVDVDVMRRAARSQITTSVVPPS